MPRYFTQARRPRLLWVEDETYSDPINNGLPVVDEHVAVDTGLLDVRGEIIWRGPNPIGFGRRDD